MKTILHRIKTGWTIRRWLYVLMGMLILIHGYMEHNGPLMGMGLWFSAMGVFSFGCAGGSCTTPVSGKSDDANKRQDDVVFEEL